MIFLENGGCPVIPSPRVNQRRAAVGEQRGGNRRERGRAELVLFSMPQRMSNTHTHIHTEETTRGSTKAGNQATSPVLEKSPLLIVPLPNYTESLHFKV